jgi:hypothetical protein
VRTYFVVDDQAQDTVVEARDMGQGQSAMRALAENSAQLAEIAHGAGVGRNTLEHTTDRFCRGKAEFIQDSGLPVSQEHALPRPRNRSPYFEDALEAVLRQENQEGRVGSEEVAGAGVGSDEFQSGPVQSRESDPGSTHVRRNELEIGLESPDDARRDTT